jgi:hypothetical protein
MAYWLAGLVGVSSLFYSAYRQSFDGAILVPNTGILINPRQSLTFDKSVHFGSLIPS